MKKKEITDDSGNFRGIDHTIQKLLDVEDYTNLELLILSLKARIAYIERKIKEKRSLLKNM